jgi:hypothetical protein
MAGRPPLRIGQHGKISRKYIGNGVWDAQCRYRDTDGVTRRVAVSGLQMNTTDTASSPRRAHRSTRATASPIRDTGRIRS